MKKMCNVLIVDKSGSMQPRAHDVRGGIKQIFETIKEDKNYDEQRTIIVTFSDPYSIETLINSASIEDLKDSIADEYKAMGSTALLDAIDYAFKLVPTDYEAVYCNIITDGEENSSCRVNKAQVQKLIKDAREKGWGVTFMGTTEEGIQEARDLGIGWGNTLFFSQTSDAVEKTRSARNLYSEASSNYGTTSADFQKINKNLITND